MSSQNRIILLVSLLCGLAMPNKVDAYAGDPWYQNYMFALILTPGIIGSVSYEVRKAYKKANKEYQDKLEPAASGPLAQPKPNLPIKEFMRSKDFPTKALSAGSLAILVAVACGKIAANAKKKNGAYNRAGTSSSGSSEPSATQKQRFEDPSVAAWKKQEEVKKNKRAELAQMRPAEFNASPLLIRGADLFAGLLYPADEQDDFCGDFLEYMCTQGSWDHPSFDADMATFRAYGEGHFAAEDSESIEQKRKLRMFKKFFQALPDLKKIPEKRAFLLQQKAGDERNGSTEKTVGLFCDAQGSLVAIQKSRSEWENDSTGYSGASGIRSYYQWNDANSTWDSISMQDYFALTKK